MASIAFISPALPMTTVPNLSIFAKPPNFVSLHCCSVSKRTESSACNNGGLFTFECSTSPFMRRAGSQRREGNISILYFGINPNDEVSKTDASQSFTTVCWVSHTVCAQTGPWGISCKGIWDVLDVLHRICPRILCCRGSTIKLCQFLEQRGCGHEHSPYELYHNCISAFHATFNWPPHWLRCSS